MTNDELKTLSDRIFKANAARDLATNFTRMFNAISNDNGRLVKVTGMGVSNRE